MSTPSPVASGVQQRAYRLIAGLLAALGLARAAHAAWLCDDAYVSFRVAHNLLDGHGLVFNAGEPVEAMTNLLWTLWLAVGPALGGSIESFAVGCGLVTFAALLATLALWRERHGGPPIALALVALHPDMATWATSGLETMPTATLGALLALGLFRGDGPIRPWLWGALGSLLYLLRPDAVLVAACLFSVRIVADVRAGGAWLRSALPYVVPGVLVVAGVSAWRVATYGQPFPNPFYAKSGGAMYLSAGLPYLGLSAIRSVPLVVGCGVAAFVALRAAGRGARSAIPGGAAALATGAAALVTVAYVTYSGGDFMHARRLIPALPLLAMAVGAVLGGALAPAQPRPAQPRPVGAGARGALPVALTIATAALSAVPVPIFDWFGDGRKIGYVADEPVIYSDELLERRRVQGAAFNALFADTPVRVAYDAGMNALVFHAGFAYALEATGLTDPELARMPTDGRGRPGHERSADDAFMRRRGIDLALAHQFGGQFNEARVEGQVVHILRYRHEVFDTVAPRTDAFRSIDAMLAELTRSIPNMSCTSAERWLSIFDGFYFDHNDAAERRAAVAAAVSTRCAQE